ncbi:Uracil-DNA glycosylase, family 4 [hydrothermal vent metagenome]|uniref:Type-4 uracil-DNA glycosylase n=1 Tax=hydrothermal vent metagenome TaxID=652676 RepID=A0A3B1C4Q4_9ZZZZ
MNYNRADLSNINRLQKELETLKLYGHKNVEGELCKDWIARLRQLPEMNSQAVASPVEGVSPACDDLNSILSEVSACQKCELHKTRTRAVFGVGNPDARLMFIGEAPGADEDKAGEPFVGRAGQLLTRMILGMGLKREDVYIANILKCRPPGNRNPSPEEVEVCEPYLVRQIEAIGPEVICALGAVAAQTLLKTKTPISKLRGEFRSYHETPLLPTFHPAYLLRNESMKREAWIDLKMVMKKLGLKIPGKGGG